MAGTLVPGRGPVVTGPRHVDDDGRDAVWVRTVPSIAGDRSFYPVLEIDDDTSATITPQVAAAHATAIGAAIARAEHDAFAVRQLRFLLNRAPDLPDVDGFVGHLVSALRKDRRPIVWPTPLRLEPGVSAFTGKPFLTVFVGIRAAGQWEIDDARRHVSHVFETLEAARLDGAYLQMLMDRFRVPEEDARATVAHLADETLPGKGESRG